MTRDELNAVLAQLFIEGSDEVIFMSTDGQFWGVTAFDKGFPIIQQLSPGEVECPPGEKARSTSRGNTRKKA